MTRTELTARIRAMSAEVTIYNLRRVDGSHIRKATQVRFEDGATVRFIERLPKAQAIEQAIEYRVREAEYGRKLPTTSDQDDILAPGGWPFGLSLP